MRRRKGFWPAYATVIWVFVASVILWLMLCGLAFVLFIGWKALTHS